MLERKRHIYAWLLLAIFVPMLMLSSLHTHSNAGANDEVCDECVHHHCSGHLTQGGISMHHCVLCQFLSITFFTVAIATIIFNNQSSKIRYAQQQSNISLVSCGFISLRAPPSV